MEILLFETPVWQIFAGIGVLLCVGEIFIPGFVALPIGVGFLLAAPLALLSDSIITQLLALAVAQWAVFFWLRKFKPNKNQPSFQSNADGMVGKECEVVETLSSTQLGYVKLYGDRWQAKTYENRSFNPGEIVVITKMDGNKVVVEGIQSRGDRS